MKDASAQKGHAAAQRSEELSFKCKLNKAAASYATASSPAVFVNTAGLK